MKAILAAQLQFYRKNAAGCAFAAHAASNPEKYGWRQSILAPEPQHIDSALNAAVSDPDTTTVSLIFPEVITADDLVRFVRELPKTELIFLETRVEFGEFTCLGFRARIGTEVSWISGFGAYQFLPVTRQSPYTEIAIRVKSRPDYAIVMKPAPNGVIHLADLDMKGMPHAQIERLWLSSLSRTEQLLGHKPDMMSAAKTTFALPTSLLSVPHPNHG